MTQASQRRHASGGSKDHPSLEEKLRTDVEGCDRLHAVVALVALVSVALWPGFMAFEAQEGADPVRILGSGECVNYKLDLRGFGLRVRVHQQFSAESQTSSSRHLYNRPRIIGLV